MSSLKVWMKSLWEFCKEDSNRVKFSFKVGLSVLLVSLLILFRAPYHVFGTTIIWSILTVAIMFEYTVGATFNKGFNRALGTLLAGILAIAVSQLALQSGRVIEPFIIGTSIFVIGAVTSLMKLWPSLVPYEYGFRVTLFTYCLIMVSGYRMGNPMRVSMERLYAICIGGIVAVLVNVLIFPIWAGEQLHKELVVNFNSLADSLQECVKKYLDDDDGSEHQEFSKTVKDEYFPNEPSYKKWRDTVNSSSKLEYLARSAKWEPPHGRFEHFFYPWSEYVKVGAVLRYCAYEVMALHGVLHSEIQVSIYVFSSQITFRREILEASIDAAELVRSLGKDIGNMKQSGKTSLLKRVHTSTERLQCAINLHSYLLGINSSDPHTISSNLSNQVTTNNIDPQSQAPKKTYHEMMRKQLRKLHSWDSREVDHAFEEEGRVGVVDFLPRMNALESTAALSLATFTSLLIEFVARLDHLVEAVDKLSNVAKFKHDQGL